MYMYACIYIFLFIYVCVCISIYIYIYIYIYTHACVSVHIYGKDLNIIFQCNLKITNHLDITLTENRKPNEEANYIHVSSDHPPSIIKEIPRSIEKHLSILSSSKNIFQ